MRSYRYTSTFIFLLIPLLCFGQTQFSTEKVLLESDFFSPRDHMIADINADGYQDIIALSTVDKKIGWIPNINGTFGTPNFLDQRIEVHPRQYSYGLGDLNMDGAPDIVYFTEDDRHLVWHSNLGDGTFGPQLIIDSLEIQFQTQLYVRQFDPSLPAVIYTLQSNTIARYIFDQASVAIREVIFERGPSAESLVVDDLDGDFTPEFLYVNAYPFDSLVIAVQNTEAPFEYVENVIATSPDLSIDRIATAEINNDGLMDIVLLSYDSNSDYFVLSYENLGDGNFVQFHDPIPHDERNLNIVDVDNDGDSDLVMGFKFLRETDEELMDWWINDGMGLFSPVHTFDDTWLSFQPPSTKAIDVNNDGVNEFVYLLAFRNEIKLFSLNENNFYEFEKLLAKSILLPKVVSWVDLDNDGLKDLLFYTRDKDGLQIMMQTGESSFAEAFPICPEIDNISGMFFYNSQATDDTRFWVIDAADRIYLVDITSAETVECSDPMFQAQVDFSWVRFQDINDDGFTDMVIGDEESTIVTTINQNDTLLIQESSFSTDPIGFFNTAHTPLFTLLHADADNVKEIAVTNLNLQQIQIFQKAADGSYAIMKSLKLPFSYSIARIFSEDLNGDQLEDLLFSTTEVSDAPGATNQRKMYWFENLGNGTWSEPKFVENLNEGGLIEAITLFDIDKDQDLDILTRRTGDGNISWCQNDGQGNFNYIMQLSGRLQFDVLDNPFDIQNNIGHDYFAARSDSLYWLQFFSSCDDYNWNAVPIGIASTSLVSGDLDNDGDPDLIGAGSSHIVWYENMPAKPLASFEINGGCGTYCLKNTSIANYANSTVFWDLDNGESSTEIHPDKEFNELGDFDISLVICNSAGCDTTLQSLQNNHVIDFVIPESAQVNEPVSFQDFSIGFTNYSWVFGEGDVSTEQSPIHTYTETGTYTVELFLTDSSIVGCTQSYQSEIQILNCLPNDDTLEWVAEYSVPETGLVDEVLLFEDMSENIVSWLWDFGDGQTSSEQSVQHSYQESGEYSVTLELVNDNFFDCVQVFTEEISIAGTSAIQPTVKSDFRFFPNPSNSVSLLVLPESNVPSTVKIFSTNGERVFQTSASKNLFELNARNLAKGVYYVTAERNGRTIVRTKWVVI